MILKLYIMIQISLLSLLAAENNDGITKIGNKLNQAGQLIDPKGTNNYAFLLVKYVIIFLGLIIMGMGINDTFIQEDRGGENKKAKGVLKMIGGTMFIAIPAIYAMFKAN